MDFRIDDITYQKINNNYYIKVYKLNFRQNVKKYLLEYFIYTYQYQNDYRQV